MRRPASFLVAVTALVGSFTAPLSAQEVPAPYREVLAFLGRQGDFKDDVLKVNIPRNDVVVTIANVRTPTPFGFGGWVAMSKGKSGMDVMMGDLVLLQWGTGPADKLARGFKAALDQLGKTKSAAAREH